VSLETVSKGSDKATTKRVEDTVDFLEKKVLAFF